MSECEQTVKCEVEEKEKVECGDMQSLCITDRFNLRFYFFSISPKKQLLIILTLNKSPLVVTEFTSQLKKCGY